MIHITLQTPYNFVGKESKMFFPAKYSLLSYYPNRRYKSYITSLKAIIAG